MSHQDALNYAEVGTGRVYIYTVREDGKAIKTSRKRYVESRVTPYLKRGHAVVKINGKEFTLKNLVAAKFHKDYFAGAYVEVIDGNPFNCRVQNLRIYSQSEHGKRTGYRSGSQPVVVDGVKYRSVRAAAKALHCSYQTLLDYINGDAKHSVLAGVRVNCVDKKNRDGGEA
ncbi:MAG: hypothetical protein FWE40_05400 [Oscillospiraceae bacterium]|nr:hypothetical protein [Oscillospiraceae bacterium]